MKDPVTDGRIKTETFVRVMRFKIKDETKLTQNRAKTEPSGVDEDWVTPERDFTSQLNRHVYGKYLQLIIEHKFNFPDADQVLIKCLCFY